MPKQDKNLTVREVTPLPEVFVKYRALSKVLEEIDPQGETIKVEYVFNQPVLVTSIEKRHGSFGDFLYVRFIDEHGVLRNMSIGSAAIMQKLGKVADQLPLVCRFYQVEGGEYGRYFDVE